MTDMTFTVTENDDHNIEMVVRITFESKYEYVKKADTIISFFQYDICDW